MPSMHDVALSDAKDIIRYQIGIISVKTPEIIAIFSNLDKSPQNVQLIPLILALILNDEIHEKFGYEE
jgi:hypothetical protein